MFCVIVAGDRRLHDYEFVKGVLDRLLVNRLPDVTVVCGCASGADSLGERWAEERGLKVWRFPADWKAYGRRAGIVRNLLMADVADALVCFPGGGPGSAHMIAEATRRGIPTRVFSVAHMFEDTRAPQGPKLNPERNAECSSST